MFNLLEDILSARDLPSAQASRASFSANLEPTVSLPIRPMFFQREVKSVPLAVDRIHTLLRKMCVTTVFAPLHLPHTVY